MQKQHDLHAVFMFLFIRIPVTKDFLTLVSY